MISRRIIIATALFAVPAVSSLRLAAAAPSTPSEIISTFYDALLSVMKDGSKLGFAGRRDRLEPAVRQAFDLPLMTRLTVGPQWLNLTATQQQQLVDAFSAFSVATYANRFDDYSGERFEVDPHSTPTKEGVIVQSKLVKGDGEAIQLNYLMRDHEGVWQIIDVYLSGTVSELATRRSEFASVMRRGGPDALVELLQQKIVQLRG
ncbi:MAG TPA: ABC transporter substrate-binding protein [Stellaceae bacterium]|nr:ABC transporter substrate-binding protein [Stellaceae bacterium]